MDLVQEKWKCIVHGKPVPDIQNCVGCKQCIKQCAHGAISYDKNGKVQIDHEKCVGCGRCIGVCNFDAIEPGDNHSNDILNKKIAEYTLAVVKGRPNFHINIITDVSPNCDCHSENDSPIVPNIGMLASFDPVALDMACADLVNKQTPFANSHIGDIEHENGTKHADVFIRNHPETNWKVGLEHAQKIGIGNEQYELKKI